MEMAAGMLKSLLSEEQVGRWQLRRRRPHGNGDHRDTVDVDPIGPCLGSTDRECGLHRLLPAGKNTDLDGTWHRAGA